MLAIIEKEKKAVLTIYHGGLIVTYIVYIHITEGSIKKKNKIFSIPEAYFLYILYTFMLGRLQHVLYTHMLYYKTK